MAKRRSGGGQAATALVLLAMATFATTAVSVSVHLLFYHLIGRENPHFPGPFETKSAGQKLPQQGRHDQQRQAQTTCCSLRGDLSIAPHRRPSPTRTDTDKGLLHPRASSRSSSSQKQADQGGGIIRAPTQTRQSLGTLPP
ncbi:unnamed protein product, partial [Ectocarpus fasciculatus]